MEAFGCRPHTPPMQPGDHWGRFSGKQRGDPFLCAVGADEHGERLVRCAHRPASVTGLRPLS